MTLAAIVPAMTLIMIAPALWPVAILMLFVGAAFDWRAGE